MTGSEKELLINKRLLFTKQTVNGHRIFCDRAVEHHIRLIREFDGKTCRNGLDFRLLRSVRCMEQREKLLRGPQISLDRRGGVSVKALHMGKLCGFNEVHVAALRFATRTNLFALGEPLRKYKTHGDVGEALPRGAGLAFPRTESEEYTPINPDFLKLLHTGEARISSSANTYYLPMQRNIVARPDEAGSGRFRTVQPLHKDRKLELHLQWGKLYSIDATEIETAKLGGARKMITKDAAVQEIKDWIQRYAAVQKEWTKQLNKIRRTEFNN